MRKRERVEDNEEDREEKDNGTGQEVTSFNASSI